MLLIGIRKNVAGEAFKEGDIDVIARGEFGVSDLTDAGIYVDFSHDDEEPFIAIDIIDDYQK